MLEPHTKKNEIDQWDVGFVLTNGTPTFFGAMELNWLERFFYDEAVKAGRYTVLNGNRPHASEVSFSTKMLLNNYVDFAFFFLRADLGCDAFGTRKKKQKKEAASKDGNVVETQESAGPITQDSSGDDNAACSELFFIHSESKDAHAEAVRTDANKMIVKKGSRISQSSNLANQKGQECSEKLRNQLIADGTIKDRVFAVDYTFNSPSTAATVILGASSSGNAKWKNMDGMTLGEILGKKEE